LIGRLALIALLVMAGRSTASAQRVVLRDPGLGTDPQILAGVLTGSYVVIPPAADPIVLRRDTTYGSSVIILGRDARVASRVHGDVIVVSGNLFIQPGAQIDGRAIAYGGGVYNSTLAVTGQRLSFRDFTYDILPSSEGFALVYRPTRIAEFPTVTWPVLYGFAMPLYDRSNGLSLAFGPVISLVDRSLELRPRLTYRSEFGAFDARITSRLRLTPRTFADVAAGRETFSNEDWIWSDFLNTASSLGTGIDTRNYYRADRADLTLTHVWGTTPMTIEPFIGGRVERAWSVGPDSTANGGPWSFFRNNSTEGMLRPNPRIDPGTISSLVGGARFLWEAQGIIAAVSGEEEISFHSPTAQQFAQTTIDGTVSFPTFGTQRYRFDAHLVFTGGDAPRQRWSYLGGAGTIPMLDLLEQGGGQLLFADSRYDIPIDRIVLPHLGSPVVSLRHLLGSAGVASLPTLEQRVGVRLSLSVVRVEFLIDPDTRQTQVGLGVSFAR
jgi:hypothetical protein